MSGADAIKEEPDDRLVKALAWKDKKIRELEHQLEECEARIVATEDEIEMLRKAHKSWEKGKFAKCALDRDFIDPLGVVLSEIYSAKKNELSEQKMIDAKEFDATLWDAWLDMIDYFNEGWKLWLRQQKQLEKSLIMREKQLDQLKDRSRFLAGELEANRKNHE